MTGIEMDLQKCIGALRKIVARVFRAPIEAQDPINELEVDLAEQLHALRQYHLNSCMEARKQLGVGEQSLHDVRPLSERYLKGHWFKYNPPLLDQQEHDGKKFKITSDTWNRLDSAMRRIYEKRRQQAPVPYKERGRRLPDDRW